MIIDVKVPQLSESVAEATLVSWHKQVGEALSRDENLIDIETDKVVLELPAPADGVLVEVLKPNGATVTAGEVIARLDTEAKASVASSAAPAKSAAPAPAAPAATSAPAAAPVAGQAMPAARTILVENGLAAEDVAGSGRGGRITKADALAASAPAAKPVPTPPAAAWNST